MFVSRSPHRGSSTRLGPRSPRWLFGLALALAAASAACRRAPPAATAPKAPAVFDAVAPDAATAAAVMPEPPKGTHLALLYSSNVHGDYEPCGCPAHPLGGIARRATIIDRARAETHAVIHVDAGDLLLPTERPANGMIPPHPAEVDRRTALLLSALARMGVHAVAPGETDLRLGVRRLEALAAKAKVPLVSANLHDSSGRPLLLPDRLVTAAGIRVGLFGILSVADNEKARLQKEGVVVADPVAAARTAVASLRARGAGVVVGLLHLAGGVEEARKLVTEAAGIDFAVLGHSGGHLGTPIEVGATRLVEASIKGKHLGRLDLHVVDGTGRFVDRGRLAQLLSTRDSVRQKIVNYRRRAADDRDEAVRKHYRELTTAAQGVLADVESKLGGSGAEIRGSWFDNRIVELEDTVPDHPAMAVLVQRYNDENQRRADKGLPVGIAMRLPDEPPVVPSAAGKRARPSDVPPPERWTYASDGACVTCHREEEEQWKTTAHAHALETLRKKGRERDPECIGCHTTGFMRPGGTRYVKTAMTSFANVGCESCHGPSVEHVRTNDKKKGTMRTVPEQVCRECHTPDQTEGEFDYAAYVKAIVGPGHGMPAAVAPP